MWLPVLASGTAELATWQEDSYKCLVKRMPHLFKLLIQIGLSNEHMFVCIVDMPSA